MKCASPTSSTPTHRRAAAAAPLWFVVLAVIALTCIGPSNVALARFQPKAADEQKKPDDQKPPADADAQKKPPADANADGQKKPPADGDKKPAEAPSQVPPAAPAEPLRIVIRTVKGLVQVRMAEDQPWQPAKVDMELKEDTELRTGPRSSVTFVIMPNQVVTLDRLGVVKVLQAVLQQGKVKTNVGLKYGRTEYKVEGSGVEHESTVTSPSATLAVRGSSVQMFDQVPYTPRATVFESVSARLSRPGVRQSSPIRRGTVALNRRSVPDTALVDTVVNTGISLALGGDEVARFTDDPARVATNDGAPAPLDATFKSVATMGLPPTPVPNGFLEGSLQFKATWTGFADLDAFVTDRFGDTVSTFPGNPPGSLKFIPSGGAAGPDSLGSGGGMETITWFSIHPVGPYIYGVNVFDVVGNGAADFTITVTQALPGKAPQQIDSFSGTVDAATPNASKIVNVQAP